MKSSKHSFMLNFVLLMLLVGPVACLPTKPQPVDDEQEVDVTDPGEGAEVHNRELSRAFQTNVGKASSNVTYLEWRRRLVEPDGRLLRETVEAREINVDEGVKGASNTVGKTTGGSVRSTTLEDRMLTAPKNELDASERSKWSGWAMMEAPSMSDVKVKKENHNSNRMRKSTSGNFGPVYGKKSDIAHSTSFGKEISENNKMEKGRTLMLLDREADASGAKRTAVETLLQYIGMPISLAIVFAACAWTSRFYEWWQRYRHRYTRAGSEDAPLLINEEQRSIAGYGGLTALTDEDLGQAELQPQPPEDNEELRRQVDVQYPEDGE
ncbi:uncharacterized protein LOC132388876 isoform X2 [Hypanus sabinus]|uniref:uncharacterized protein LOC132388876 isoform X2 n=1 Tax=Hypanus sabinus TaxID=79690 RepID=UPI0028C4974B|nr:uncharacterized protein LOC132388876 isoform X2 [Hypanus sabinus]